MSGSVMRPAGRPRYSSGRQRVFLSRDRLSGVHSASCAMSTRGFFSWINRPEGETSHCRVGSGEVEMA